MRSPCRAVSSRTSSARSARFTSTVSLGKAESAGQPHHPGPDRTERRVWRGTGASFAPQAIAARHVGGLAVAIDPYAAAEAEQVDNAHILEPLREELRKRDWTPSTPGSWRCSSATI